MSHNASDIMEPTATPNREEERSTGGSTSSDSEEDEETGSPSLLQQLMGFGNQSDSDDDDEEDEDERSADEDSTCASDGETHSIDSSTGSRSTLQNNPALNLVAKLVSDNSTLQEIAIDQSTIASSRKDAVDVAHQIANALKTTTYLTKLTLKGNWAIAKNDTQVLLSVLIIGLIQNKSIKDLIIHKATMDRQTGQLLGMLLARNKRIKRLTLSYCHFVGSGFHLLLMGLQHSKTIQGLTIQNSLLLTAEDAAEAPLLDGIAMALSLLKLQSLKLQATNLNIPQIPTSAAFLFDHVRTLTDLDLSHNHLGAEGIQQLLRCLSKTDDRDDPKQKQCLQTLTLENCGLTQVKPLVQALWNNKTLKQLNISHNAFGSKGASRWQALLEKNPTLVTLQLVGCGVSANRLQEIANQLRYNQSVFQKVGLSSDMSLAVMDSWSAVQQTSKEYLKM